MKWATLKRKSHLCITCRVLVDARTDNWAVEKIMKMTLNYYAARKASNPQKDRDISPCELNHIAPAEFLV